MKKLQPIVLVSLFLLVAVAAVSAQTPITRNEQFAAGAEAAKKGDYKTANQWYTKALKHDPNDVDILYARAGTFIMLKKPGEAVKDLDTLLATNPANPQIVLNVLYARASYLNMKGDHKRAHQDVEAIFKIDPNHAGAYQARGTAYLGQKKYKESEADLTKAIELNPRDHVSYTVRAAVYEMQGMAAQAQADKLKAEQIKGQ